MSRVAMVAVVLFALIGGFSATMLFGAGKADAAEGRIATVNIVELLQDQLATQKYSDEREANRANSVAELQQMEEEMRRINGELQLLTAADQARGQRLYADLQQRQQVYRDVANRRTAEFQALSGRQAAAVYADIHRAASELAKDSGYSHVFVSRPGADIEETESLSAVIQGLLSRPAIMFPQGDDLTDRVRERLSIPRRPTEPAPDATPAGQGEGDEPDADQP